MVELVVEGFEGFADFGVIDEPAHFGIGLSGDDDFDDEAVAVQAAAFVTLRKVRQEVRGFELKGFAEFDFHVCESKLHFPVGPIDEFAEGGSSVVAPAQGWILHLADRTDARGSPFGEFVG